MRILTSLYSIALGAGLVHAPIVAAQAPTGLRPLTMRGLDDVKPGAKLRVTTIASPPERFEGRFGGVVGSTMTLGLGGSQRRELNVSQLLRVDEAYRDRKRGALVGILPGIVGVYAWDFFGPHPRYADQDKRYRENITALAISVGVGGLIGAAIGWERWRPVLTSMR